MKKILVIEDEELVRHSLIDVLEAEEFEVVSAENGMIGIGLVHKEKPDIIICDIMMPQLDGYGVLTALQQDPLTNTIPFIFLTAKADKADLRQGMQLGADDYLTKPFTRTELLNAVNTRLEKHNAIYSQLHTKIEELCDTLIEPVPDEFLAPLKAIKSAAFSLYEIDTTTRSVTNQEILAVAEKLDWAADRIERLMQNFQLYIELEIIANNLQQIKVMRQQRSSNAADLIQQIVLAKAKTAQREADIKLGLQEATVKIADMHLQKVVEELVDNAFKYSLPGTSVGFLSLIKNATYIIYITMDNDHEVNTKFFNWLNGKNHEQSHAMTGLGLAIARRLVEIYEGEVYFGTIRDGRARVRVTLPCVL
ncbi:MAG: response regulator [Chloroflexi bacterium]|nr:response regulator [Chloroflexota bacterium]